MNFIIKRKVLISMLFLGLTLLGYISYKQLPVELQPNVELPVLFVQIASPGEMAPKYFENQAVIPVEGAIGTMEGIESLESWIYSRRATIIVKFKKGAGNKYSFLKLQEKMDKVKSKLPEGFFVQVNKVDLQQLSNQFMELQIRGTGGIDRVRNVADKKIKSELENIDGIASANIYGGKQKSIEVVVDKKACDAYGITLSQIRSALNQNSQSRTFSGYLHQQGKRYFVHVAAEYEKVNDIANIVINKSILLKDIAEINFGVKEETSYSRVNGKEAVAMTLVNDAQANLIDLSHKTRQLIQQINGRLAASDIEIVIQEDAAEKMEKNINQIILLAIIGGLLAIFVLWIFLKNLRLVTFIALSIPISVFTAFNLFYAAGISINSLTLVGMALAIGMLLDNSVVVLENIYRLAAKGKNPETAVVQGTSEVWRSIFAATLTTITVFLPFVFSDNFLVQALGKNIGVSIISTLVVSLLAALLLIPMVAYTLLKRKKSNNIFFEKVSINSRVIQIYVLLLKSCMRYPARTILGAVMLFFITVIGATMISVDANKEVETNQFNVYVTMPSGSDLEKTDVAARRIENQLKNIVEIKDILSRVKEEEAIITIQLKDDFEKIAKRDMAEIKVDVTKQAKSVSDAEISTTQPTSSRSFRGGGGGAVSGFNQMLGIGDNQEKIIIKGQDFELMRNVAEDIRYHIDNLEAVRSSSTSSSQNRPEIHLQFYPLLLNDYGITLATIAQEFNSFSNEFASGAKFKQQNTDYDIIIKEKETVPEKEHQRKTVDDLRKMNIRDAKGGMHNLQELAQIVYADGMSNIRRVNQEKQIEVFYSFGEEAQESKELLESYRREIDEVIAAYNLPAGVAVEVIHKEDPFKDFKYLILAAFLLIFMILASVFESVSTPFVLMFSIPLAAVGSLIGLILSGNSLFNANTLTGFLILLGVVVNNGIILIDYTQILRRKGYRKNRALLMAGISRVRPIMITAITTIIALLPLAMGDSEYVGVIGAPFGITVIGGLAVSTLLTLVFIPTAYSGLEEALNWLQNLSLKVKIIQWILMLSGAVYIYFYIDSFVLQMVCTVLLFALIPGVTYFVQTSLRRAELQIIDKNAPLQIGIQNLVKIYDRPSRFVREWRGGVALRKYLGIEKEYRTWRDFDVLIWQIPLAAFIFYFTFYYLESKFLMFVMAHAVYFMLFVIWQPLKKALLIRRKAKQKAGNGKLIKWGNRFFLWGVPILFVMLFAVRWSGKGSVILTAMFWAVLLIVYVSSEYLYNRKINIDRISGKFGGLRRAYFRLVKQIPIVGKRKIPFKALNGVSLEIRTGMFGLLGPNGAGKSTMMRVICGIFEQSYGKIWINGLDTQKYREELQGLIGYLPQEFGTYENMSAYEFLDYQAMLKGIKDEKIRSERLEYVLKAVHMYERKDEKIGAFSGGMKQRIGIAQILLHLPRILVVDEPTAGLDPRERIRFRNLLVELSRERIVIFSTHIIEDIASSCNQVAVINRGEVRYTGNPQDMVHLGEGLVWQYSVSAEEWEQLENKQMIVHHIQDGDRISIRCLAKEPPTPDAVQVQANLEDAYLCLLKSINN